MTNFKKVRADSVRFYLDDVILPGRNGVYRAASHERSDKADRTLFVSTMNHRVYVKDDTLVYLRVIETN